MALSSIVLSFCGGVLEINLFSSSTAVLVTFLSRAGAVLVTFVFREPLERSKIEHREAGERAHRDAAVLVARRQQVAPAALRGQRAGVREGGPGAA